MPENIDELKKLELLNEARRLLNTEYNQKKSDEYNNWLLKNSQALKSTNLHLPFPPFVAGNTVPYYVATVPIPTEHEVVARAVQLYNTRYNTPAVPEAEIAEEVVEEIQKEIIEDAVTEPEEMTVTEPIENIESITDNELAGLQLRDAMIQEIYNIYGDQDIKDYTPSIEPKIEDKIISPEADLNTIPQPSEELAKLKSSNNSFASIYQKFQSMKDSLINPTNKGSS
jgi:hypothetical protein